MLLQGTTSAQERLDPLCACSYYVPITIETIGDAYSLAATAGGTTEHMVANAPIVGSSISRHSCGHAVGTFRCLAFKSDSGVLGAGHDTLP
jgi:hypothetical protein